ncbi:ABC transporter substrate-binding protein [Oleiagrimonas sp.]|uniref:MlaC/ttg2D family ABC transporter substrate-binding protein n=1 Tax=Oleiagrimonas sp. TaxID=2010330 RepID=UPI00260E6709|nr:ABC transporter substrate-binding protein [Oleiagrimonas sp.]MDA3913932.1 ABC transporter substrate-binding protein [Oleiagrimonas sp.]
MKLRSMALALALVAPAAMVAVPAMAAQDASATDTTQQAAATPEQVVKQVTANLAKAIDGHREELKKNKSKLIKIIDGIFLPHFDIDYASILVLGRHARQATPEQRERFAKAFYNSITQRYAEGLVNYNKGSVKVLPFKGQLNDRRTMVRTQVMLDDGKTISVDYAFHKTQDGHWEAYDVVIEGISYITNYRAQVDAEIRKLGIEGLIDRLQKNGAEALKKMQKDGS